MIEFSLRTPPRSGTTIASRYELVRSLPASPLGWRFLALDTALERTEVQLTLIYPHHVTRKETIDRIQQEILATRQLVHPNIAQIFDFDFAETGQPFICSEFLSGVALRELLSKQNGDRLSEDEVLQILAPVAEALAYTHRKGMVHGGVAPDVIWVLESGIVKITDFGYARSLHNANGLTLTGETAFLPEYLAPEQLLNPEPNPKSDLYAFGCIAYEMLTGTPPFKDECFLRLTEMHQSVPIADLPLRQCSSPWLAEIVLTCCTPAVADRTLSAEDVASSISAEFRSISRKDLFLGAANGRGGKDRRYLPLLETLIGWTIGLSLLFWLYDQNGWRYTPVHYFLAFERALHNHGLPTWPLYPLRTFLQIEVSLVDTERNFHLSSRHHTSDCLVMADFGFDLSTRDANGTPLMHLLANDIQYHSCISYGANPRAWRSYLDARDSNGNSALHIAVLRGDAESAAILTLLGAEVTAINAAGDSPLDLALKRQDRPILRHFIKHSVSEKTPWGQPTLVYKYLESRDPGTIALGLEDEKGMRPLRDGTTPLMHAIDLDLDPDLVAPLFDGPLRASRTIRGEDALFVAVERNSDRWVEALLAEGFSPRTHNIDGDTPLHIAARFGSVSIVRALLDHTAVLDEADGRGRTALDVAREAGRKDIEAELLAYSAKEADGSTGPAPDTRAD